MNTRIINTAILCGAVMFTTGCKKFLDVNTNPNVAQDVPVEILLSSAQIYSASALGVDMNINGGLWAQYWAQAPSASQYKIYEQYQPSANNYDRCWQMLYSNALEDLDRLEKKATAENKKDYVAVAKILKAYDFQLLTDGWGDIPFSQALKGLPADGGIISPAYDRQEAVYDGIIAMLSEAKTTIEELSVTDLHGDLIYNGDLQAWYDLASTLQLKCYLRMSEVNAAKAQAGVAALYASSATFLTTTAQINYISTTGNQNPLYSEITGLSSTQNLVGSSTTIDTMTSNNDLRLQIFYSGTLVGIPQGGYTLPASTVVARPGAVTGASALDENSALAPIILMADYESYLLQAEAVARGWAAGDDQDLFEEAIYASFKKYEEAIAEWDIVLRDSLPNQPKNLATLFKLTADYAAYTYIHGDTLTGYLEDDAVIQTPSAYWGQYPSGGGVTAKVRHIITQKWLCMTGTQGFEAWTEWRRTGYPDFFTISLNSNIGNRFPTRFLYPNVELTRNANFPGQKVVTDKVWWDIN